jgi:hypothetical protein
MPPASTTIAPVPRERRPGTLILRGYVTHARVPDGPDCRGRPRAPTAPAQPRAALRATVGGLAPGRFRRLAPQKCSVNCCSRSTDGLAMRVSRPWMSYGVAPRASASYIADSPHSSQSCRIIFFMGCLLMAQFDRCASLDRAFRAPGIVRVLAGLGRDVP